MFMVILPAEPMKQTKGAYEFLSVWSFYLRWLTEETHLVEPFRSSIVCVRESVPVYVCGVCAYVVCVCVCGCQNANLL